MSKLIDIAKECGADVFNPGEEILGTGEFVMLGHCFTLMDADQLRATVEQVAGPLVTCLEFVAISPSPADKQYAIEALAAYRAIMGEKK